MIIGKILVGKGLLNVNGHLLAISPLICLKIFRYKSGKKIHKKNMSDEIYIDSFYKGC